MKTNSKWLLDGKRALITGGTKGIGLATAEEFLQLGAEVIITARHAEALDACIARWTAAGFRAYGVAGDAGEQDDCVRLLEFVQAKWGGLDILVNNAGTNIRKPTSEYSEEEISTIFDTNLKSAFGLCRLFYPMLRSTEKGCIVNVSSIAGLAHMRSGSPYGMTKAAMNQMTRNLAVEWAKDGIRVNAVAPGFTKTPLTEFWQGNDAYMQELAHKTPLARMGEAEEIAAAIAFLAMPASSFTTGQCLCVDGGFIINAF
jgi:Tropinone reductase 1